MKIKVKLKNKDKVVKVKQKEQPVMKRQYTIIDDRCPDCGNHLRQDSFTKDITCSYVKCVNYE